MTHDTIPNVDELRISTRRQDGTFSNPVVIWYITLADKVIARSVHGETAWFRALSSRKSGQIQINGQAWDVTFDAGQDFDLDAIDEAYKTKYARYSSIVPGCINDVARAATFEIIPVS